MSRPEHQAPPEIFYNDLEARKYTTSSRIQSIQTEMTERCLELLNLPIDEQEGGAEQVSSLLLDIGCGSGLSGEIISEFGHHWVGVDISGSMLEVAVEREVEGDLCLHDIGQGFGFRPGSFDGAISVSVIQWLCNADKTSNSPPKRLKAFFESLFSSLVRGARAVFQFYPESDNQVCFIMSYANRAGFTGGLVVDYPNSQKAKKFYLVLMTGPSTQDNQLPKALDSKVDQAGGGARTMVKFSTRRSKRSSCHGKKLNGKGFESKQDWILKKKELYRKRGKEEVPLDSKFTGRKRRPKF
ncbi:S-adenosyl-L-methionine-dependent methyltransferase [Phakopsora pachyrhizi]|uniref:S-adenosyl-L-methionine-dependent methyltransferase n=1 Tax=Phakopsora pachyrhizi TaxID=170000 RepID=A0AAV0BUG1_PHAPC|nr:S-adenosyl-L-methionine-dependent methyltransferase [Phakopsora pachyrhizi]CAH7690887.1 S-adenosyl-L-methionine-dependent methyltransferase [Phakopsora pachyrhizi]